MRNFLRLFLILLVITVVFFLACEKEEEEEHPLVGTWDMTNMEQSSTYYADTDAYTAYGITDGMVLGAGEMTWVQFSALGVEATVTLKEDGTFTLSGNFPIASDTLGLSLPPSVVPLNDLGEWVAAADLSTLLIDGSIYDIGGTLTLDDQDNPTVISMYYTETDVPDTVVLMIDANQDGIPETPLDNFPVTENSETTIGFTKQ